MTATSGALFISTTFLADSVSSTWWRCSVSVATALAADVTYVDAIMHFVCVIYY